MFRLLASFRKFTTWMLAGLLVLTAGFGLSSVFGSAAAQAAAAFSAEDRTVLLNGSSTVTFSEAEMDRGRRLFGPTCGHCHIAGSTYTNPDIELSLDDLSNANPRRDTVEGIVDYVKNPTTYDGMESLADFHPNLDMDDIYIEMRGLSENDVKLIAGYILQQAKVNPGWGQSKNIAHDPTFERLQRK